MGDSSGRLGQARLVIEGAENKAQLEETECHGCHGVWDESLGHRYYIVNLVI